MADPELTVTPWPCSPCRGEGTKCQACKEPESRCCCQASDIQLCVACGGAGVASAYRYLQTEEDNHGST